MSSLILKRASASRPFGERNDDDFDVLTDSVVVGRIMKVYAAARGLCVCRKPRPFDLMKESRNVGHDGRAILLPFEAITFAIQADQPTRG